MFVLVQQTIASSYYPGRGDNNNALTHVDSDHPDTDTEDAVETAEDWMGDDHITGPSKISEAIAAEVSVCSLCSCLRTENFFLSDPYGTEYWVMPHHLVY